MMWTKKHPVEQKLCRMFFCVDMIILLFHYEPLTTDYDTLVIGCHSLAEEVVEG